MTPGHLARNATRPAPRRARQYAHGKRAWFVRGWRSCSACGHTLSLDQRVSKCLGTRSDADARQCGRATSPRQLHDGALGRRVGGGSIPNMRSNPHVDVPPPPPTRRPRRHRAVTRAMSLDHIADGARRQLRVPRHYRATVGPATAVGRTPEQERQAAERTRLRFPSGVLASPRGRRSGGVSGQ